MLPPHSDDPFKSTSSRSSSYCWPCTVEDVASSSGLPGPNAATATDAKPSQHSSCACLCLTLSSLFDAPKARRSDTSSARRVNPQADVLSLSQVGNKLLKSVLAQDTDIIALLFANPSDGIGLVRLEEVPCLVRSVIIYRWEKRSTLTLFFILCDFELVVRPPLFFNAA